MSSSTLLNIALHSKIFGNFTIENFEPIMLTEKYKIENETKYIPMHVGKQLDEKEENVEKDEKDEKEEKDKTRKLQIDYIEPKQHDSLFWCLYIIAHGYNDYMQIGHNYGVKELEEKQKVFQYVKTNTSAIKNTNYKITNVAIQEMLSEFMTVQKRTSYLCLIAMVVYYNINIFIVDESKKTLLEFLATKDTTNCLTYVLYITPHGKYKLQSENICTSKMMELRDTNIVVDSYLKPLKAISNYKVDDIEAMLKKIGKYEENKKYKKQDLYDKLLEAL
jgi:hypothetical protein